MGTNYFLHVLFYHLGFLASVVMVVLLLEEFITQCGNPNCENEMKL